MADVVRYRYTPARGGDRLTTMTTMDEAPPHAPPRPAPAKRRRGPRTSPQLLVALLAGLLAVGGYVAATGGTKGTPVAIAARDIAAGETVTPADVRLVDLAVPPELNDLVLRAADVNGTPRTATHALAAGTLLQRPDLSDAATAPQRGMSIPIDPVRAVNGSLRVGDLVDVIDASGPDPAYVLTGARVLAVGDAGGGRLGGSSQGYSVTVAVEPVSALRVAAAIAADKVSIVRSTGAAPTPTTPPTVAVRR